MPRVITIVSPDVPEVNMFLGTTIVRTPKFTISPALDESLFGLVPHERPERPALEVPHPMIVIDGREVERVVGVRPPAEWVPCIMTQCFVPHGELYDMWVQIVADVARMCNGFAVEAGRVVPLPEPWPWYRGEDGRWCADDAWMDQNVETYYARHPEERNPAD
ncbi:hypothetical protein [Actinomyces weissii]|uniref:Uncharacterized protein n=1 Tax=Actinomyces weissii TaxID=675090 RepID=A0A7T7MA42_9ACTO|nr:hypothetical protein [Actinomyces weissii]QQM67540.1 hypothetical protein JG540_01145 [Actinomyces weissii]